MAVHRPRTLFPGVTPAVSSGQEPSRHMETFAYRCFLPDLTEFTKLHCVRPDHQHHLPGPDPKKKSPQHGFNPAIADCRLQGTATTPFSTAKLLDKIIINSNNSRIYTAFTAVFSIHNYTVRFIVCQAKQVSGKWPDFLE